MENKQLKNEIEKRRTFAIISHPDAGKTTLTEKLLLYGGAINLAGSVKGKKSARHATSDWMEIEKQRGISVTSSVLQFKYGDKCINILDTPGHQDFSEDTYRTLMAADSAVMVLDASKGVENQTRKLFKVCVMRGIPIFTFVNKLDRDAMNPFDLMEQVENELGIATYPINFPIGSGKGFKGVYDREKNTVLSYEGHGNDKQATAFESDVNSDEAKKLVGDENYNNLMDDIELLDGAGTEFDIELVRNGKLTPVFFGSALTNFGVEPFLEGFLKMTTPPLPRLAGEDVIDPLNNKFSAFVFKIQANMNKAHRDRLSFMRICSGKFERDMDVLHVQSGRKMRLSQPQQMMAQEREIVDTAYAGDIIGVFDPGIFTIGDTVCSPDMKIEFDGIPTFAPEHFERVRAKDTLKRKQFVKGTTQIAQEGAIQIFTEPLGGFEEVIVGVVGVLQFEVLEYRLKHEYGCDIVREGLPYSYIRWIENDVGEDFELDDLILTSDTKIVQDIRENYLLIFTSEWNIQWALDKNPKLTLSEFGKSE
ncbi:MAG: peptide chain release factor 3 [Clostridiales bacterium]|mgnify:CR=1 FL=1|nr:peptide chain release factor 3 [Clostridiales bacterium]